jgi:hypothetical protein
MNLYPDRSLQLSANSKPKVSPDRPETTPLKDVRTVRDSRRRRDKLENMDSPRGGDIDLLPFRRVLSHRRIRLSRSLLLEATKKR